MLKGAICKIQIIIEFKIKTQSYQNNVMKKCYAQCVFALHSRMQGRIMQGRIHQPKVKNSQDGDNLYCFASCHEC